MNNKMAHCGPNYAGIMTSNVFDWNIGLRHRRLSILVLSTNGNQPMSSLDGNISIVFNGEIYNHFKIREVLQDYTFKSNSDTETIIAAYLKWGEKEFLHHLNGMFAFALFDKSNSKIILARDRIGINDIKIRYVVNGRLNTFIVFPYNHESTVI